MIAFPNHTGCTRAVELTLTHTQRVLLLPHQIRWPAQPCQPIQNSMGSENKKTFYSDFWPHCNLTLYRVLNNIFGFIQVYSAILPAHFFNCVASYPEFHWLWGLHNQSQNYSTGKRDGHKLSVSLTKKKHVDMTKGNSKRFEVNQCHILLDISRRNTMQAFFWRKGLANRLRSGGGILPILGRGFIKTHCSPPESRLNIKAPAQNTLPGPLVSDHRQTLQDSRILSASVKLVRPIIGLDGWCYCCYRYCRCWGRAEGFKSFSRAGCLVRTGEPRKDSGLGDI